MSRRTLRLAFVLFVFGMLSFSGFYPYLTISERDVDVPTKPLDEKYMPLVENILLTMGWKLPEGGILVAEVRSWEVGWSGVYVPKRAAIIVPEDILYLGTQYVVATLAHELAHANDESYFIVGFALEAAVVVAFTAIIAYVVLRAERVPLTPRVRWAGTFFTATIFTVVVAYATFNLVHVSPGYPPSMVLQEIRANMMAEVAERAFLGDTRAPLYSTYYLMRSALVLFIQLLLLSLMALVTWMYGAVLASEAERLIYQEGEDSSGWHAGRRCSSRNSGQGTPRRGSALSR